MSEWQTCASRAELDLLLANHIAERLRTDLASRGQASLAVSGGGTPKGMFQALSHCELDWSQVTITLVDERWVSPDSEDSNERLVREYLLQHRAATARFLGLKSEQDDAVDGLATVSARLADLPRPVTLVVLGMGDDGHTASWFPQADNLPSLLDPAGKAVLGATHPVTAPHQRITLTLPAVLDSRELIIHITGDDKKAVLQSAREQDFPIAAILQQQITPVTIWWAP